MSGPDKYVATTAAEYVNKVMSAVSAQMLAALRLLDCECLTARQLNDRLYQPISGQSRRVFAASMSRTIRRLKRRGLISCESGTIAITQSGWITIHPDQFEATLTSLRESVRQAVAEAWVQYRTRKPRRRTMPRRLGF